MSGVYVSSKSQPVTSSEREPRGIYEAQPASIRQAARQRQIIAAILAIAFCAILAINLPGHLSYDSVDLLLEGRSGRYAGWHPPIMSWLLGIADSLNSGAGLYVTLQCAIFFVALGGLLFLPRHVSRFGPLALVAILVLPQIVLYQGIVWKDVLFADAAFAGFVCLAVAARYWRNVFARYALIASACLLFALAALARQNGVLILPFGAASVAWCAARFSGAKKWWHAAIYGVIFLLASGLIAFIIGRALDRRSADHGVEMIVQLRTLETYDLIAAAKANPSVQLDILHREAPALDAAIRGDGAKLYSPRSSDTLHGSPKLLSAIGKTEPSIVTRQWRALVWQHPSLYLKTRSSIFAWVFFTPEIERCVPFIVGVQGPPDAMRALGMVSRTDNRDRALLSYAGAFLHTPVFSHFAFALVALGLLVFLLFRNRPEDIAIALMLAASIVFALSFFVISIACDYRYLYFLDLAALAGLFYFSLDPTLADRGDAPRVKP